MSQWQNLLINRPAHLRLHHHNLSCSGGGEEITVPLTDIATITVEDHRTTLTNALLAACSDYGITVITCNAKHIPNGALLSFNSHSRVGAVLERQIAWSKPLQKQLWQQIIQTKISNQAMILQWQNKAYQTLENMVPQVRSGDTDNREAVAARYYFSQLFDCFRRHDEDKINAALNYGYAIVRASIARELVGYGFQPALGLHHHSELNGYNLADDLLEPFRPIVDSWVCAQINYQTEEHQLSVSERAELTKVLQLQCTVDGMRHRLQSAVTRVVVSLTSISNRQAVAPLSLPTVKLPPQLMDMV